MRKVVITGANGFLGRNLVSRLLQAERVETIPITRDDSPQSLKKKLEESDFVFHLAAAIRPKDESAFHRDNVELTSRLLETLERARSRSPVIFSSSSQVSNDTLYGQSKRNAERLLTAAGERGLPVKIYRFPGIFGKWCKPNYNSVVATFCHNLAQGLPVVVHDQSALFRLVYIEDVLDSFMADLEATSPGVSLGKVSPEFELTVGQLESTLRSLKDDRLPGLQDTELAQKLRETFLEHAKGVQLGNP
ncbi:MAG: NAD-dependent epimerase/dehydratase family protein [Candidatus Eremiobacteraeota bacterium]|nr:NAD-dependent epimerase/dehydratase family protein [Candidatus Eremiobacteraeota bacterium]